MSEIKPEPLRARVCATPDIVADASFSIENWVMRKAERAMRLKVVAAVISGNGMERPVGILHPNSGIPICDTSPSMTPGEFAWQDLVALKYQVDEP